MKRTSAKNDRNFKSPNRMSAIVQKNCIEIESNQTWTSTLPTSSKILIVGPLRSDPPAKSDTGGHDETDRSDKLNRSTILLNITELVRRSDWIQD